MSKKILITGGAGFVGSSLCLEFKRKYADYAIIAFDNLKRRGSELNLKRFAQEGIIFIHGDVRNKEDFDSIPDGIDLIIEASAEPSVLSGINGTPDYLFNTNLNGTINCLNFAKRNNADFIFLSTSRIYPVRSLNKINYQEDDTRFVISSNQSLPGISVKGVSEEFNICGSRSFYGASKLASELIISEYNEYYRINTVINRCGVITGPWQMGKIDQGVVVLWLAMHFWKRSLSYIGFGGEGKQVRDILHVRDLFDLIDFQAHQLKKFNAQTFNVGGGNAVSISLKELTSLCKKITGNSIKIDSVKQNRPADIRIYISDNSRISEKCGWEPKHNPEQILTEIFEWVKNHEKDLKSILL